MTWFKVDDRFHSHPKVLALRAGAHEEAAIALWLKAGSWCASNLTDGVVPAYVIDTLVRRNGSKASAELVRVGLWERTDDGFRFRSWSEYQPSKSDVESKREKTAKKVADWREKKRAGDQACNRVTRSDVTAPVTLPPTRPDPSRSLTTFEMARASGLVWNDISETYSRLRSEAWQQKTGNQGGRWSPGPKDHGGISAAMDLFSGESDPIAALEDSIRGFLADPWAIERDWPFSAWARDPGRFRGKAPSKAPEQVTEGNPTLERFEAAKRRLDACKDPEQKGALLRDFYDSQRELARARVRGAA